MGVGVYALLSVSNAMNKWSNIGQITSLAWPFRNRQQPGFSLSSRSRAWRVQYSQYVNKIDTNGQPLVTSLTTGSIVPDILSDPLMVVTVDLVTDENAAPSVARVPDHSTLDGYA